MNEDGIRQETALTQRPRVDLARQNPVDLAIRLADMKENRRLTHQFFKDVMEEGVDYGIIPGTDKPTLFKPGAEGLCELYGYAPTIKNIEEVRDFETGFLRVVVTIALIARGTGEVVAEGIGECNTREARYFYRWTPEWELKRFPELWTVRDSLKKEERSWKATTKRKAGSGIFYRVENDDLFTLWNTVLKMAKKRAHVDATLSATRSSGLFSQGRAALEDWIEADYEDVTGSRSEPSPPPAPEPPPPPVRDQAAADYGATTRAILAVVKDIKESQGAERAAQLEEAILADYPETKDLRTGRCYPQRVSPEHAGDLLASLRRAQGGPPAGVGGVMAPAEEEPGPAQTTRADDEAADNARADEADAEFEALAAKRGLPAAEPAVAGQASQGTLLNPRGGEYH